MSEDQGSIKSSGLSIALIVLGFLVISLLVLVVFVDPITIQPDLTLTATLATGTPQPTPTEAELLPSPVVNIDGIAILGGVMALLLLAAVYREILIHKRAEKKK
ncbi:MAG TPA: hypothetical protein PLE00_04520 [Anaerolineaceae bacterium]|nr:hypothetical protein [Anaerolineaceae bacterium]